MREIFATWSVICEPGDTLAGYLRRVLGSQEALALINSQAKAKDVISILPEDKFRSPQFLQTLDESLECWRRRLKLISIQESMKQIEKLDGTLITPEDEYWPVALSDLGDGAPTALWVLGDAKVLGETGLSVIGSRLASDYGLELTRSMVRYSVNQDWVIVSGGALGIDAMASASAIGNSGKTVAVMAGGLDQLYPKGNYELFERIRLQGCLVSEVAPGVSPSRWRFLQRNRLIAALGQATLVVEAGFRSGSINTAGHANEIGRPVGAVPGRIDSVRSAGCHRLIREGRAELIATPGHLMELMGNAGELDEPISSLSANQKRAMDALGFAALSVEQVAVSAGMTLQETEQSLHSLVSSNLVQQTSLGWRKQ